MAWALATHPDPGDPANPVEKGDSFLLPWKVAYADNGDIVVTDKGNRAVKRISKISGDVEVLLTATTHGVRGLALARDGSNDIFFSDGSSRVFLLPGGRAGDAVVLSDQFNEPEGIAVDADRNIYVAEYGLRNIKKISNATGQIVTLWTESVKEIIDVDVDSRGTVYFLDGQTGVYKIAGNPPTAQVVGLFDYPLGFALAGTGC